MARSEVVFGFAAQQAGAVGKYFDIGCNKGYLLAQGIKQGWDVHGCELVPELSAPFRNSYKQQRDNVYCGRFADIRPKFENNTFELITAIDVIEHFEDVVADMRGIYDILKPGGALVIQTPDAACEQAKRGGCHWGALKPLKHLHLFNQKSLEMLAQRVGFRDMQAVQKPFEDADGNFVVVLRK
jgi:SAM-dependent methyltransferase